MKKINPGIILILSITLSTVFGFVTTGKKKSINNNSDGFAVVELFTSEGCSSCPAADKVIAELSAKNIPNVFVLSYHVDYWDRLGWKDAFSKSEFSARQRQYATQFKEEGVYTPQVIVNGVTGFVGSDESKVYRAIADNTQHQTASDMNLTTSRNENTITVFYDIKEKDAVLLNIALVQPEATTNVRRGENEGRTLHHVNIVRELKTVDAKGKGSAIVTIPKELMGIPLEILTFTQQKADLKILAANKIRIEK